MAKELRFDVSAIDEASKTFSRLGQVVDRFKRKLDDLDGKQVDVDVDLDTRKAEAKGGAFARDIKAKIEAAVKNLPELKIEADSSDVDRAYADIRRKLAELGDKRIGIDISAEQALAETEALKRELETLARTSPDIRVRTDAAAALAELNKVKVEADKLDGKTVSIKVKTDKSFSNATTDIALLGRSLAQLAIPIGIVAGAPAIASLGQSAKQAAGSMLLIPAAATAAGLAVGTLVVGFKNFGDAVGDDPKKAAEAMSKMAPAAREAATAVNGLKPAWDGLRLDVQGQLFDGLGEKIKSLGGSYIPILRGAMTDVAQAFNYAGTQVATFLQKSETVDSVRTMFDNLGNTIENVVSQSAAPLVSAFTDLGVVGSGVLLELSAGTGRAAQGFATFIAQARQSGQLEVWMRKGVDVLKQLGQVAVNTGSILSSIFKAADASGKPFLSTLVEVTGKVREFMASAQGQSALVGVFESIRGVIAALLPGIQAVGRAIAEIVVNREASGALEALASAFSALVIAAAPVIVTISGMVARAITPLANALGFLAPVIGPVVGGLIAMKAASSALSFTAAITGMTAMKAAATGAVGSFNSLKAGSATAAAATTAAGTAASGAGAAMRNAASGAVVVGGATAAAGDKAASSGGKFDGLKNKMSGLRSAAGGLAGALPLIGAALTGLVAGAASAHTSLSDMNAAVVEGGPALERMRQQIADQGDGLENSTNWLGKATNAVDQWLDENFSGVATLDQLDAAIAENNRKMAEQGAAMGVSGAAFAAMRASTDAANAATTQFTTNLGMIAPALSGIKNGIVPTQEMQGALDALGRSAGDASVQSGLAAQRLGGVGAGANAAAASMQQSRDAFIAAATAAGMTSEEANKLADRLHLIPSEARINFESNAATAAMEIDQVNQKIQAVPPGKAVTVTAMTDAAKANLESLGFTVTRMKDGTITVTAKTEAAKVDLDLLHAAASRPENKDVNLNTLDAHTKARVLSTEASKPEHKQVLAETSTAQRDVELLGSAARRPENKNINLDTLDAHTKARVLSDEASKPENKPVGANIAGALPAVQNLGALARQPESKPVDVNANGGLATVNQLGGAARAPETKPVGANTGAGTAAVGALQGQAQAGATKPVNAATGPAISAVAGVQGAATAQATKPVNAQTGGALGAVSTLQGKADSPASKTVNAQTGGALGAVSELAAAASRTVTMVVNVVKHFFGSEGGIIPNAEGNVIGMTRGGSTRPTHARGHRLSPMGTRARVVGPDTWRVVGDRAAGDEAYIPLTKSPRSRAILGTAANRMGFDVFPTGSMQAAAQAADMRARVQSAITARATAPVLQIGGGGNGAELAALRTQLEQLRSDVLYAGHSPDVVTAIARLAQTFQARQSAAVTANDARTRAALGLFS